MCTAHRPFAQFKHTPDLIASTKLMIAMSSANIDAAMPRVIAYFEKHVKPRADEEAYRTLIRLCAKAMRGDLVSKYWQVRVTHADTYTYTGTYTQSTSFSRALVSICRL